jgi:hypothetical protein
MRDSCPPPDARRGRQSAFEPGTVRSAACCTSWRGSRSATPARAATTMSANRHRARPKMEATRCLERRLSDIVYRRMLDDAIAHTKTRPGGHRGTSTDSSVTSSHPHAGSSEKWSRSPVRAALAAPSREAPSSRMTRPPVARAVPAEGACDSPSWRRTSRRWPEGGRHRAPFRGTPAYRTAPRGPTSTAATPRAYNTRSRSPCLQRRTPASSASAETTWSITSSSPTASGSS